MTATFVLRHPQTAWNVQHRYQGRLDVPLNRHGISQIKLIARAFEGFTLDAVYTSPLCRARDLATAIAHGTDAPLVVDERLVEIGMGPWEGLLRPDIQRTYPEQYRQWYEQPERVRFAGGETLQQVWDRSQSVLGTITARYPAGLVAIVTHGVVVQCLAAAALGLPSGCIHRIRPTNGGITTLCGLEPPCSLLSLNVTSPLYKSPVAAALVADCVTWKERRLTQ